MDSTASRVNGWRSICVSAGTETPLREYWPPIRSRPSWMVSPSAAAGGPMRERDCSHPSNVHPTPAKPASAYERMSSVDLNSDSTVVPTTVDAHGVRLAHRRAAWAQRPWRSVESPGASPSASRFRFRHLALWDGHFRFLSTGFDRLRPRSGAGVYVSFDSVFVPPRRLRPFRFTLRSIHRPIGVAPSD